MESREPERCSLRGKQPSHKCEQGAEVKLLLVAKGKMNEETKLFFFSGSAPCQLKQFSSSPLFLLLKCQGHSFRYSPLQGQNSLVSQVIGQQLASTISR